MVFVLVMSDISVAFILKRPYNSNTFFVGCNIYAWYIYYFNVGNFYDSRSILLIIIVWQTRVVVVPNIPGIKSLRVKTIWSNYYPVINRTHRIHHDVSRVTRPSFVTRRYCRLSSGDGRTVGFFIGINFQMYFYNYNIILIPV